MYARNLSKKGFTIIELLVVISIIGLLSSIVIVSLNAARATARDKQRISDLAQIQLALKLYQTQNGEFPCENPSNCSASVQTQSANGRIGEGNYIDTLLIPYIGNVPMDPKGPSPTYNYYIDPNQICGGNPNQIVIFAKTMETDTYKNANDTICTSWGGEGGAGNSDAYMIIIGPSKG